MTCLALGVIDQGRWCASKTNDVVGEIGTGLGHPVRLLFSCARLRSPHMRGPSVKKCVWLLWTMDSLVTVWRGQERVTAVKS